MAETLHFDLYCVCLNSFEIWTFYVVYLSKWNHFICTERKKYIYIISIAEKSLCNDQKETTSSWVYVFFCFLRISGSFNLQFCVWKCRVCVCFRVWLGSLIGNLDGKNHFLSKSNLSKKEQKIFWFSDHLRSYPNLS